MKQVVHAACPHDCPDACGVLITVDDGRAVKIQGDPAHPVTRGFLCAKVAKYLDRVYSPDRVLYPMRRMVAKGPADKSVRATQTFQRITWDEALDEIASRFEVLPQNLAASRFCLTPMAERSASSITDRWTGGSFTGWERPNWRATFVQKLAARASGRFTA